MASRLAIIGALVLGWVGVIPAWLMWSLAGSGTVVVLLDFYVTMRQVQRTNVPAGSTALVGKMAIAVTPLAPEGFVLVEGERWSAEMEDGSAAKGEHLAIVGATGMHLRVRSASVAGLAKY